MIIHLISLSAISVCMHAHLPSLTLTPQYTIFPSIPHSVVPDLPLPGLTVSAPHSDHREMHCRLLSCPTVCVVEEHFTQGCIKGMGTTFRKLLQGP